MNNLGGGAPLSLDLTSPVNRANVIGLTPPLHILKLLVQNNLED